LAAYNAGPDAAMRWYEAGGDDIDAFVQEIEYDQAKAYVHLVTENLAMYRYAYGLTERPSLQP
jgi:soluble lytic murein transglycosylase-like protein